MLEDVRLHTHVGAKFWRNGPFLYRDIILGGDCGGTTAGASLRDTYHREKECEGIQYARGKMLKNPDQPVIKKVCLPNIPSPPCAFTRKLFSLFTEFESHENDETLSRRKEILSPPAWIEAYRTTITAVPCQWYDISGY